MQDGTRLRLAAEDFWCPLQHSDRRTTGARTIARVTMATDGNHDA